MPSETSSGRIRGRIKANAAAGKGARYPSFFRISDAILSRVREYKVQDAVEEMGREGGECCIGFEIHPPLECETWKDFRLRHPLPADERPRINAVLFPLMAVPMPTWLRGSLSLMTRQSSFI